MQLTGDSAAFQTRLVDATSALVGDDPAIRFGIAVSGGPDSMALLCLAASAFPGRVAAVTVDHGLRRESADEAALVARWCVAHGIEHVTLTADSIVTGNVQAWARTTRYRLMEAWRASHAIDWIMTAHHADDQLETLVMRLNRGSGIGGLAGVRAVSGSVIRPLLGERKSMLQAFVDREGLPYVQDPSNRDRRFDRAALRMALSGATWLDAQAATRSAAALADAEAAILWSVTQLADQYIRADGDGWRLVRTDFPREYLRRLVLHMLMLAGSKPPRGESLDRALQAAATGHQASLGDWLLKGGAIWTLWPAPPRN